MKISKVYTKTGDQGMTSLVGGIRIDKSSTRLEAYGTVDELSSQLGLLASIVRNDSTSVANEKAAEMQGISELIERVQNTLFNVCSYLATDTSQTPVYESAQLHKEEIAVLEKEIDLITPTLPILHSFVLPGGTMAASQAHVCRTVCRRAERRIVALTHEAEINPDVLRYINRLSDYLFVLARKLNFIASEEEKIWRKTCK